MPPVGAEERSASLFVSIIIMNVWENLNPHMYIDSRFFAELIVNQLIAC